MPILRRCQTAQELTPGLTGRVWVARPPSRARGFSLVTSVMELFHAVDTLAAVRRWESASGGVADDVRTLMSVERRARQRLHRACQRIKAVKKLQKPVEHAGRAASLAQPHPLFASQPTKKASHQCFGNDFNASLYINVLFFSFK